MGDRVYDPWNKGLPAPVETMPVGDRSRIELWMRRIGLVGTYALLGGLLAFARLSEVQQVCRTATRTCVQQVTAWQVVVVAFLAVGAFATASVIVARLHRRRRRRYSREMETTVKPPYERLLASSNDDRELEDKTRRIREVARGEFAHERRVAWSQFILAGAFVSFAAAAVAAGAGLLTWAEHVEDAGGARPSAERIVYKQAAAVWGWTAAAAGAVCVACVAMGGRWYSEARASCVTHVRTLAADCARAAPLR